MKRAAFLSVFFLILNFFSAGYREGLFAEDLLQEVPFPEMIRNRDFWSSQVFDFRLTHSSKVWKLVSGRGFDQHFSLIESQIPLFFGLKPFTWDIWFDSKTSSPREIRINFWNKGDALAHPSVSPKTVQKVLESFIAGISKDRSIRVEKMDLSLEAHVRTHGTMIFFDSGNWFFEIEKNEYMTLRIFPPLPQGSHPRFEKLRPLKPDQEQKILNLERNVQKRLNGDWVIFGIPMINQGKKGYCAPASCARVLQYYEYPIDEHQIAKMMQTGALSGTSYTTLKETLKKISMGSPLYFKEIKFSLSSLQGYIEKGIPVFWGIRYPAHLRLVIGVNLRERKVIYSDSWGEAGLESAMPFDKAKALTSYAAVLK